MVVGVLEIVIAIPGARSLKEKRKVVKSLKDRLRNNFNISVAEIANQDIWQTATLGVAVVSGDMAYANGVLSRIQDMVGGLRDAVLTECRLEWR
ncbi:MAG: DUF503 domain-containing protein [candidate division Zixibacteria bacterium]